MVRKQILIIVLLLAAVLAACAPKTASLENTSWKLIKLGDKDVPAGIEINASFHAGQITGKSACNSYFASYTQKNSSLELGPAGSTMMACLDDGVMQWEIDYLTALGNIKSFKLAGSQLDLLDANNKVIMSFGK